MTPQTLENSMAAFFLFFFLRSILYRYILFIILFICEVHMFFPNRTEPNRAEQNRTERAPHWFFDFDISCSSYFFSICRSPLLFIWCCRFLFENQKKNKKNNEKEKLMSNICNIFQLCRFYIFKERMLFLHTRPNQIY